MSSSARGVRGVAARRSTQTATAANPADTDAGGWMGRPTTDANAMNEEDPDIFPARTPADVDREFFREGDSVKRWNEWRFDGTPEGFKKLIDDIAPTITSQFDARYWAYHVFRSSWFLGQGAAGLLASSVLTRSSSGGGGGGGGGANPIAEDGGVRAGISAGTRLMAEAVQVYKQDLGHINAGMYKAPYDMDPRHRQFNPLYVADKTARFLSEATSTLAKNRAAKKSTTSKSASASGSAASAGNSNHGHESMDEMTKVWMGGSNIYPDYYLKTFHWQTDGWLSSKSAEVYEVSTETLFLGRQDAMQRTALVPLAEWFREKTDHHGPRPKKPIMKKPMGEDEGEGENDNDAAMSGGGGGGVDDVAVKADGEGARLLELACGTGRFLTFVRDNYPKMDVTGLDLSPFYLMEARKNSEYWEKLKARRDQGKGHRGREKGGGGISGRGGERGGVVGSMFGEALSRVGGMAKAAGLPLPPLPPGLQGVASGAHQGNVHEEHIEAAEHAAHRSDTDGGTVLGKCEFVHAQAESIPFPDETFDAVTCVYLLHELPPAARRAMAAEASRVLKPGGVLVVADSIQLGDRPRLDPHLGRFGDFNEPHYRDYIASELVSVFGPGPGGAGLTPWTKELCSSTKVLSFRKPAAVTKATVA